MEDRTRDPRSPGQSEDEVKFTNFYPAFSAFGIKLVEDLIGLKNDVSGDGTDRSSAEKILRKLEAYSIYGPIPEYIHLVCILSKANKV